MIEIDPTATNEAALSGGWLRAKWGGYGERSGRGELVIACNARTGGERDEP